MSNYNKSKQEKDYRGKNKRKPSSPGRNRDETRDKAPHDGKAEEKHFSNDPKWYAKYPDLLQTAAKVPFVLRPGMVRKDIFDTRFTLGTGAKTLVVNKLRQDGISIPGVMTLNWIPSFGISESIKDPASIVARELYSRVRSNFSGPLSVDAPDLFMQVGALASIYSYIAWMKRVYRTLNTNTPNNYMIPNALLKAMGFKDGHIKQLFQRRMELLGVINNMVRQIDKFICPSDFDYINRQYWMNDNVFVDSPNSTGQIYIFNQVGYFYFNLLPTPDSKKDAPVLAGGLATFVHSPGTYLDNVDIIDVLSDMFNTMVSSLSAWEECYDINGYFMKAFSESSRFGVELLKEDETLNLIYDPVVLSQIQNSNAPHVVNTDSKFNPFLNTIREKNNYDVEIYKKSTCVLQDPNTNAIIAPNCYSMLIQQDLSATNKTPVQCRTKDVLFNVPDELTNEVGVVEASRLTSLFDVVATYTVGTDPKISTYVTLQVTSGTEIITSISNTYFSIQNPMSTYTYSQTSTVFINGISMADQDAQAVARALLNEAYNYKPIITVVGVHPHQGGLPGAVEDLDTWAYFNTDIRRIGFLSRPDFETLNEFCLLSQLSAYSLTGNLT